MARLDHPNVVRVYDSDRCGGICYIAMELCEGGSLADWLDRLPKSMTVPASWAAELVARVADGVQHAHDRGVYHRDLKPANILLAHPAPTPGEVEPAPEPTGAFPRFQPKVGDFGLAKFHDQPADHRTATGALVGTRHYMAPGAGPGGTSRRSARRPTFMPWA